MLSVRPDAAQTSAFPHERDEPARNGGVVGRALRRRNVDPQKLLLRRADRDRESPAALECVYLDTYVPRGRDGAPSRASMVFGEVVGVHLDERLVTDGRLDTAAMRPIARMGYDEYAVVESAFRMTRPDNDILGRIATR